MSDGDCRPRRAGDWPDRRRQLRADQGHGSVRGLDRPVHRRRPPDGIVLDVDSSESPTYGGQEGSAYNGHFGCTCYHPLIVVNQFGDLERCSLRPDNAQCAKGWRDVLEPVIVRYPSRGLVPYFRGDAASAKPEFYELLEAEGIGYAIRLPANPVLQERIAHLLTRPAGHALKVDRARRKPRTDPRRGLTSLTPTVAAPLASLPVDEQPFEEHRRT